MVVVPSLIASATLASIAVCKPLVLAIDNAPSAIAVALPVLVTTPVKLAFVVTVAAFPPIFKLATGVVDVTTNGAVPVATVDVSCPVTLKLVPVAAPNTGVTNVGDVASTATPDPVSFVKAVAKSADVNEPKVVAFPVDVTAPVKLALVVTVAAFPVILPDGAT